MYWIWQAVTVRSINHNVGALKERSCINTAPQSINTEKNFMAISKHFFSTWQNIALIPVKWWRRVLQRMRSCHGTKTMEEKSNNAKTDKCHGSDKTNYEQCHKHKIWGTSFYLIVFGTVQLLYSTSCTGYLHRNRNIAVSTNKREELSSNWSWHNLSAATSWSALEQLVSAYLSIYRKKSWQFKIYTLANHMKISYYFSSWHILQVNFVSQTVTSKSQNERFLHFLLTIK